MASGHSCSSGGDVGDGHLSRCLSSWNWALLVGIGGLTFVVSTYIAMGLRVFRHQPRQLPIAMIARVGDNEAAGDATDGAPLPSPRSM